MKLTEAAWLAGMIEGDGSIGVDMRVNTWGRPQLKVEFDQTGKDNRDIVRRVARLLGTTMTGSHGPYRGSHSIKPRYRAVVYQEKAKKAIKTIWSWLGNRRRKQARAALKGANL